MDFFGRQEQARRSTKRLVLYFTSAVIGLVVAVYAVFALLFRHDAPSLWDPDLFALVVLGTVAVIAFGSLYKIAQLREGGSAVARLLGGRLLDPNTQDHLERKLLNVVEEMAIASGTPVPAVYVLDEERGINAFAAGFDTSDMAIGVTRGCIELLTRDELQGVIGHEFSHILNGDMRLNLRLMGVVHGILCLAIIGRILLRVRSRPSRDRKGGNPLPLIGLGLLLVGWIGVFFGKLIKSAVSRQREFLADAASVQFTRNPEGLAGALKKIGGLSFGSRLATPRAEEASHLFFSNGLTNAWVRLMSTHPPLVDRIRAIEPRFDGVFPSVEPPSAGARPRGRITAKPEEDWRPPRLAEAGAPSLLPAQPVASDRFVVHLGAPTPAHLNQAAELKAAIPPEVHGTLRDPFGASATIYALLLSSDPGIRDQQLHLLETHGSAELARETRGLHGHLADADQRLRLPLVDLALPALHRFSLAQYQQFKTHLDQLVSADQAIDLFEFALKKIVLRNLDPVFQTAPPRIVQFYALRPLLPDCAILLAALAAAGHEDRAAQTAAFQQGLGKLHGVESVPETPLVNLETLEGGLNRLALATPAIKKTVLNACVATVSADGWVQPGEAELMRAVAEMLDCPVPPMVPGRKGGASSGGPP